MSCGGALGTPTHPPLACTRVGMTSTIIHYDHPFTDLRPVVQPRVAHAPLAILSHDNTLVASLQHSDQDLVDPSLCWLCCCVHCGCWCCVEPPFAVSHSFITLSPFALYATCSVYCPCHVFVHRTIIFSSARFHAMPACSKTPAPLGHRLPHRLLVVEHFFPLHSSLSTTNLHCCPGMFLFSCSYCPSSDLF